MQDFEDGEIDPKILEKLRKNPCEACKFGKGSVFCQSCAKKKRHGRIMRALGE